MFLRKEGVLEQFRFIQNFGECLKRFRIITTVGFFMAHGGVVKPDTIRVILKRDVLNVLAKKLGSMNGRNLSEGRLHSFRHFFCSQCAAQGVSEQTLMEWLGHRDNAMVRHYFHLNDEEAQRQMKKISLVESPGAT